MGETGCKCQGINTPPGCPPPTHSVTLGLESTPFPHVFMWNEASVAHSTDGLINVSLVDFLFFPISLPCSFPLCFPYLPNKLFVFKSFSRFAFGGDPNEGRGRKVRVKGTPEGLGIWLG